MATYATIDDVQGLYGETLDDPTVTMAETLLRMAADLMRAKVATIDARIAAFDSSATPPAGLDPQTAADVNAAMVVRVLQNPEAVASEAVGPSTVTYGKLSGQLTLTENEILLLAGPPRRPSIGTVRLEPGLAPKVRPFGPRGPSFDRPRRTW